MNSYYFALGVSALLGFGIANVFADSFSLDVNNGSTSVGVNVSNDDNSEPPPVVMEKEVVQEPEEDRHHFEERHHAWERRHQEQLRKTEERRKWEKKHHKDEHRDVRHAEQEISMPIPEKMNTEMSEETQSVLMRNTIKAPCKLSHILQKYSRNLGIEVNDLLKGAFHGSKSLQGVSS